MWVIINGLLTCRNFRNSEFNVGIVETLSSDVFNITPVIRTRSIMAAVGQKPQYDLYTDDGPL